MKRLLISGFVAVAILALMTTLRSHSVLSDNSSAAIGAASSKNVRPMVTSRLPVEDFEDMSVVFSTPTKH